jgi:hypothetical protein
MNALTGQPAWPRPAVWKSWLTSTYRTQGQERRRRHRCCGRPRGQPSSVR